MASEWCRKMQYYLDQARAGESPFVFSATVLRGYVESPLFTQWASILPEASNCHGRVFHIREKVRPRFPAGREDEAAPDIG